MGKKLKKNDPKEKKGDPLGIKIALDDDISKDDEIIVRKRKKRETDNDDQELVTSSDASKIFALSREQKEYEEMGGSDNEDLQVATYPKSKRNRHKRLEPSDIITKLTASDDEFEEEDFASEIPYDEPEQPKLDDREEQLLAAFMPQKPTERKTLAEIIQMKIMEKEADVESVLSDGSGRCMRVRSDIDPRVVEMYKGVRDVLAKYRSGKLPKAFKMIPKLVNWEQILAITEPHNWTSASVYQAVRIFASNLSVPQCQRFYNYVLLPRVRDDIAEFKRLNFHLFQALHKALFKPGAFFKGFLLPLMRSGDCTLREAVIVSSALAKSTIPMLHAAALMLKIAQLPYTGASSIFLRTLIDKKYTLPCRVIDELVLHFMRMESDSRELPVLWHQSLLAFVQRYKMDMSDEQIQAILRLTHVHYHYQMSEELRKELQYAIQENIKEKKQNKDKMEE